MPAATVNLVESSLDAWKKHWAETGWTLSDTTLAAAKTAILGTIPADADTNAVEEALNSVFDQAVERDEPWAIQAAKELGFNLLDAAGEPIWPLSWVEAYSRLKAARPGADPEGLRGIARLFDEHRNAHGADVARQALISRHDEGRFPQVWTNAAGGLTGAQLADIMAE